MDVEPAATSSSSASAILVESAEDHEINELAVTINSLMPTVREGKADVVELFCPGRLQELSKVIGLVPGGAFDLRTGWDLSNPEEVAACWRILEKMKPTFILGSPKCAPFSQLQHLNKDTPGHQQRLAEGLQHLKFVTEVYRWQHAAGR